MNLKSLTLWSAVALLTVATACSKKSPTSPSSTDATKTASTATASTTSTETGTAVSGTASVSMTAPTLISPGDGEDIRHARQPVTLVFSNAVTTASGARTYAVDVASDPSFNNKAYSKDGIAEGPNGQTSLEIAPIGPGTTYVWRARVSVGGAAGPNSKTRTFTIGPEVKLDTPVPVSPAANAAVSGAPMLTVNNVARTGPAGNLFYQFDLSDSSSFGRIVFTTTAAEQRGTNQTSVQVPNTVLPTGGTVTFYWRVRVSDPFNAVTTPFSGTSSFQYSAFDMRTVVMHDSPSDFGFWPETAKITMAQFTGDALLVDFDRRLGPNRWPDEPFGSGSIEYTLGICLNINKTWHCSGVVQYWFERPLEASGIPGNFWYEWWYAPERWGPMTHYGIAEGEIVGVFVGSGNLRMRNDPSFANCPRVCERSNVVMIPYTAGGGPLYVYSKRR